MHYSKAEEEKDYQRSLRAMTKAQLFEEVQFLRTKINEWEKRRHIDEANIQAGHRAERAYKEKIGNRRFLVLIAAAVTFGIGYALYPALLQLMSLLFVIYLFMELQLGE